MSPRQRYARFEIPITERHIFQYMRSRIICQQMIRYRMNGYRMIFQGLPPLHYGGVVEPPGRDRIWDRVGDKVHTPQARPRGRRNWTTADRVRAMIRRRPRWFEESRFAGEAAVLSRLQRIAVLQLECKRCTAIGRSFNVPRRRSQRFSRPDAAR